MYDTTLIIHVIDSYLERNRRKWCSPAEAGRELAREGVLFGCEDLGAAVREMIHDGKLSYAYKEGRNWRIPKSPDGYLQELMNKGRTRLTVDEKELLRGVGLLFGIPFLIVGILLVAASTYEAPPNRSSEEYRRRSSDWARGLDPSIPATQLIHYDYNTGTAIYGEPSKPVVPITPEEYEANKRRYFGDGTVIRDGDDRIVLDIDEYELMDQLMDNLDLLDYYEEYNDR